MADDKSLRSPQDASRVAMGEDYEVAYSTHKFGVTRDELQAAVDAVGNGADGGASTHGQCSGDPHLLPRGTRREAGLPHQPVRAGQDPDPTPALPGVELRHQPQPGGGRGRQPHRPDRISPASSSIDRCSCPATTDIAAMHPR